MYLQPTDNNVPYMVESISMCFILPLNQQTFQIWYISNKDSKRGVERTGFVTTVLKQYVMSYFIFG